jgi:hypothetical protein
MFWRRRCLLALAAALISAPIAAPTALAAPASGAPAGSARLYLPDVFFVHGQAVTVPRRVFHVVGITRPYVAGEALTVQVRLGRRIIKTQRVVPAPSRNRAYGHFRIAVGGPSSGGLVVTAAHDAKPQLGAFRAQRGLTVLDPRAGPGATGRFVQLIQQRLAALHFYIPQTGVYDAGTGWAIDAYHRLLHWGTSQRLDGRTISFLLDGFGSFHVRFPGHGRHAEGNLSLQLLALVDGSHVHAIYPISSGKPSTPTILGDYHVYSKVPGYLPDGMYFSNFFIRGFAIHGYNPAPDYPASHGCMRLPISDAISVYGWLAIGDWVDVYY